MHYTWKEDLLLWIEKCKHSHQNLSNLSISHRISPYLITSHRISSNVPNLNEFYHSSQNFNDSYKMSPYLTESHQVSPYLMDSHISAHLAKTKCQSRTSCGTILWGGSVFSGKKALLYSIYCLVGPG